MEPLSHPRRPRTDSPLAQLLRRAAQRGALQAAAQRLVHAVLAVAAAGLAWTLLGIVFRLLAGSSALAEPAGRALLLLLTLGGALWALLPLLRRPDLAHSATTLDTGAALDDLLATAWELEQDARAAALSEPWSALVARRAEGTVRALRLEEVLPWRVPRLLGWSAVVVTAAVALQLGGARAMQRLHLDRESSPTPDARQAALEGGPEAGALGSTEPAAATPGDQEARLPEPDARPASPQDISEANQHASERMQELDEQHRSQGSPGGEASFEETQPPTEQPTAGADRSEREPEIPPGFRELRRTRSTSQTTGSERREREEGEAPEGGASDPDLERAQTSMRREVSDEVVAIDMPAGSADAPATPAGRDAPQDAPSAMTAPLPKDDDPTPVVHGGQSTGAPGEATAPQIGESQVLAETAPPQTLEVVLEEALLRSEQEGEAQGGEQAWRPSERQELEPHPAARVTYASQQTTERADPPPPTKISARWRDVLRRYFDPETSSANQTPTSQEQPSEEGTP